MKTKLLLFDFDGTLFNTSKGIHRAVNIVAEKKGLEPFTFEMVQSLIGHGLDDLIKKLDDEAAHKLGQLIEFREEFKEVYNGIALEESELYPGAIDYLKSWDGALAIVSNKGEKILKYLVQETELSQFDWATVIGGDSLEQKKPHPLPLKTAMEAAGFGEQETLLVGDGVPDVQGANAAKIPFIAARYGYAPESELIQNGCRFFIDSFSDLPEQIQLVDVLRN